MTTAISPSFSELRDQSRVERDLAAGMQNALSSLLLMTLTSHFQPGHRGGTPRFAAGCARRCAHALRERRIGIERAFLAGVRLQLA